MSAYEPYCDGAFECWTTRHLENFVNVVAGGSQLGRRTHGVVGLRRDAHGAS
jgi:hypothetical protein